MLGRFCQQSCLKILVWLVTEIILNFLGIDDLADYSEFVFAHASLNNNQQEMIAIAGDR